MSNNTCSVDGCDTLPHCKGMCGKHYARLKRYGDPLFTKRRPRQSPGKRSICEVDGCESIVKGHGFCLKHYQRYKKTGNPLQNPSGREMRAYSYTDTCEAAGCDARPCKLGYCGKHYQRVVSHGDPTITLHRETCSVDGCGEKHFGRGYCSNHRYRFAATGNPLVLPALENPHRICPRCGAEFDISIPAKGRKNPGYMRVSCEDCTRDTKIIRFVPALVSRDGKTCGICREEVDLSLRRPNLMSRSVDHIVPWSHGGSDDLDNLQLTHLHCNIKKNNRLDYVAE